MLKNSKQVIAVDLDEVLFPFVKPFFEEHFNPKFGTNYIEDDIFTYELENVVGKTREEVISEIDIFYKSGALERILPFNNAAEIIDFLRIKYALHAVTARPDFIREETQQSLQMHFPKNSFQAIHFTNQYHGGSEIREKVDICKLIGAIAIVEDSYRNAIQCADSGMKAFLLKKPWSEYKVTGKESPNLFPINNLREILKHL